MTTPKKRPDFPEWKALYQQAVSAEIEAQRLRQGLELRLFALLDLDDHPAAQWLRRHLAGAFEEAREVRAEHADCYFMNPIQVYESLVSEDLP